MRLSPRTCAVRALFSIVSSGAAGIFVRARFMITVFTIAVDAILNSEL